MTYKADRATGVFFLALGILLYFVIIPIQVEAVDEGWVFPNTIPNAVAIVLSLCGTLLALKPTIQHLQETTDFVFAGLYFLLLAASLFAMSHVGFIYTAPVMALAIMLFIGERRPLWLSFGVIGMPLLIWILVVQVLDRPLP